MASHAAERAIGGRSMSSSINAISSYFLTIDSISRVALSGSGRWPVLQIFDIQGVAVGRHNSFALQHGIGPVDDDHHIWSSGLVRKTVEYSIYLLGPVSGRNDNGEAHQYSLSTEADAAATLRNRSATRCRNSFTKRSAENNFTCSLRRLRILARASGSRSTWSMRSTASSTPRNVNLSSATISTGALLAGTKGTTPAWTISATAMPKASRSHM